MRRIVPDSRRPGRFGYSVAPWRHANCWYRCCSPGSSTLAATSGCAVFVNLPVTPGLANLSEDQVFAMAPPPEWPAPQADNPQAASVAVSCGIGPRLSTGQLYAAVSVKGRPAATALGPLNIALVLDRSGSMHGDPFRNMLMAAETFVGQLRDGDRVSIVAFSDGVYLAAPPVIIDGNTRNLVIASIRTLSDGGGTNLGGGFLAGLAQVFGAFNPWQVNQVVLFSDGQPNIGITSSSELARIAARAAEQRRRRHDDRLRHGARRAVDAGNGGRVGRQLLLRRQPGRHVAHLPARGRRHPAHRRAFDRRRSGAARGRHARRRDRLRLRRVGRPHVRAHRQRAARSRTLRRLPLQRRPRRAAADRARVLGSRAARAVRRVVRARVRRAQRRARQLGAGARRARGGGLGPSGIDGVGGQRQRDVRHLADRLHARHHRGHARAAGSAGARRRGQDAARRAGEPGPQGRDARRRSRSWAAASGAS